MIGLIVNKFENYFKILKVAKNVRNFLFRWSEIDFAKLKKLSEI